ncbi:MAG: EAL domain-containing protein [Pseudomonadota bacterium]
MFSWFEQLQLRTKLGVGFGIIIALMLLGSCVGVAGHLRTVAAVEEFLVRDDRIDDLTLASTGALGNARRYEKEFLLKRQLYPFQEAKSRYATMVASQIKMVRDNMGVIRQLSDDADIAARSRAIERITRVYEAGFLHVVELYGRLGRAELGQEGALRRTAQAMEIMLVLDGASERLRADLLALRAQKKDFLMRNGSGYVAGFASAAASFRADLAHSALSAQHKERLRALTDQFASQFDAYAATLEEIDMASQSYLLAVNEAEPQLDQLHMKADGLVERTRATIHDVARLTATAIIGGGIAALLLGVLVASFIVRSASASILACLRFAPRLAAGDWSARLPPSGGKNEFAVLAKALNSMADDMQHAHAREQQHVAELVSLNRTLHMLSRCSDAQAGATGEAKLLQSICQCTVVTGSYALAWIALKDDQDGAAVALAACFPVPAESAWEQDGLWRSLPTAAVLQASSILLRDVGMPGEATDGRPGSCIALPLRHRGQLLGALCICSDAAGAFFDDEVRLLQELADNLTLGMLHLRDGLKRAETEQAMAYQASHDPVTGLPNRMLFCDRLRQAALNAGRSDQPLAVVVLGLDRFKATAESLGHELGNDMLRHVGRCLAAALRDCDIMARLSDDSFAIVIAGLRTAEDAMPVALKLLACAMEPLKLDGGPLATCASIGISVYPRDGDDSNQLLRNATAALASAQARGGRQCRYYAPDMNERIGLMYAMERDLRVALAEQQLRVYYQPKVNLASGEIVGAEALVRWQHPLRGMVSPAEFIPLAESTDLIYPLGEWVIRDVCRQQRAWLDAAMDVPPVAVNLSSLQFRQKNLLDVIRDALASYQLEGRYLQMEITESSLMDDLDEAVATLRQLKELGIELSLDDFGTGHSSLSRLRRLPIDHLKIDQSFVGNLTLDPADAAVCRAIIDLAHCLHMHVIAEGVETEGQAKFLRDNHCDDMQGYYFSRPVPAKDYAWLLMENTMLDVPVQPAHQQRTLLLVDDESNILSALKRTLRRDGYRILTAGSAREGLELLALHEVQVVLSDQRMGEMNGTEFLSRVRDLYPDTMRIVLSGYTDLNSITDAINRGSIYKFLTKPWDDTVLRDTVREAFRRYEIAEQKLVAA